MPLHPRYHPVARPGPNHGRLMHTCRRCGAAHSTAGFAGACCWTAPRVPRLGPFVFGVIVGTACWVVGALTIWLLFWRAT